MQIYPAIRAKMGRWDYYIVKMTMRELAESVRFATDVWDNRTLDEAIQRTLNEGRVKKDLVKYLIRQQDRFFASVVVAALGGTPKWYPVTMEDDERFILFRNDARLNQSFGLLSFDGTQNYYALDGQHRLAAIKSLVNPNNDVYRDAPTGFALEEVSVIVVVPREAESQQDFLQRYRRLFGNLNRYAKAMDQVTNIIMDEDDAFAILTRRLILEHEFFQAPARVKTEKGKNLNRTDAYFTSLEALYDMNTELLHSSTRRNHGWDPGGTKLAEFKRYRPDEQILDELYDELEMYWDGILAELPMLREDPPEMRRHELDDGGGQDLLLFWPIGQEILAEVARSALDQRQPNPDSPRPATVRIALAGLGRLPYELHEAPWRHLLLVRDAAGTWRMRSEERAKAQVIGRRLLMWLSGLDELDEAGVQDLRKGWQDLLLIGPREPEAVDELWAKTEAAHL